MTLTGLLARGKYYCCHFATRTKSLFISSQLHRMYPPVRNDFKLCLLSAIFITGATILIICRCISNHHNVRQRPIIIGKDMPDLRHIKIDLCKLLDTDDFINRDPSLGKQWWEWACLLEREWDKPKGFDCKNMTNVAGNYHPCFDNDVLSTPCLVYSFGIDNDFSFDDAMAQYGCEVHSFDPSMGVEDHVRPNGVHFHNLGLATNDSNTFRPLMDGYVYNSGKVWKIKTLKSIKKMLGHEKRSLAILKMDIETYEWPVMAQLLKDGLMDSVGQLLIEWHILPNQPMRTEFGNMYHTVMKLKKQGFRQIYRNDWSRFHSYVFFNSQMDAAYVNSNLIRR